MIWLSLLLVANTAAPTAMMFGGPLPSLKKLAAAARECGYKEAAVVKASFGATIVALPVKYGPVSDPRLDCAMNWFLAHPELELGVIGNKALKP